MNKQNFKYSLVISSIVVEEETYNSYGIACSENDTVKKCIEDVSIDKKEVSDLIDLFNKLKLDPIQMEDVIEDALS